MSKTKKKCHRNLKHQKEYTKETIKRCPFLQTAFQRSLLTPNFWLYYVLQIWLFKNNYNLPRVAGL